MRLRRVAGGLFFLCVMLSAATPARAQRLGLGGEFSCATTANGGVRCWGLNDVGQLGDGTNTSRARPVAVVGLSGGVADLAVDDRYACALTTAGGVKCWGANYAGQLGDGTTVDRATPVDVSGLTSGVTAVATGTNHACALLSTGRVKCWGQGNQGALGTGNYNDQPTPVDVSGLTNVVSITAGTTHTCAATASGAAFCWGGNIFGQLGDGTTARYPTPNPVFGLGGGVAAVAVGDYHSCARMTGGAVKCWGFNRDGEIGDGTTTHRYTPVDVSGLASGVTLIAPGDGHTCAITTGGGLVCWGLNSNSQLGDGTRTDRTTPVSVADLSSGVTHASAGFGHTCATVGVNTVKCWGANNHGQIGNGTTAGPVAVPTLVAPPVAADAAPSAGAAVLTVAPQPAREAAHVALALPSAAPARVALFDMLGRQVGQALVREASVMHTFDLPVATLPAGLYVLRVEAGMAVHTRTVVVAR